MRAYLPLWRFQPNSSTWQFELIRGLPNVRGHCYLDRDAVVADELGTSSADPMGNSMGGKCSTLSCTECSGRQKKKGRAITVGRWTRLQTSGRSPSPRSGHDVAVIGNKVCIPPPLFRSQSPLPCSSATVSSSEASLSRMFGP